MNGVIPQPAQQMATSTAAPGRHKVESIFFFFSLLAKGYFLGPLALLASR